MRYYPSGLYRALRCRLLSRVATAGKSLAYTWTLLSAFATSAIESTYAIVPLPPLQTLVGRQASVLTLPKLQVREHGYTIGLTGALDADRDGTVAGKLCLRGELRS